MRAYACARVRAFVCCARSPSVRLRMREHVYALVCARVRVCACARLCRACVPPPLPAYACARVLVRVKACAPAQPRARARTAVRTHADTRAHTIALTHALMHAGDHARCTRVRARRHITDTIGQNGTQPGLGNRVRTFSLARARAHARVRTRMHSRKHARSESLTGTPNLLTRRRGATRTHAP